MYINVEEVSPDQLERKIWTYLVRTPIGVSGDMQLALSTFTHAQRKSRRHRTWSMLVRWDRQRSNGTPRPDVPEYIRQRALTQYAQRVEFSED